MTGGKLISPEYAEFLESLKEKVRAAQVRAGLAVNRELVILYWEIGHEIATRQQTLGWGAKVAPQLSKDLRRAFPEMKGFSPRNLNYMKAFYEAWPDKEILQQLVAIIPWGHLVRILDKTSTPEQRLFYVRKTMENGWSRNVLMVHMERDLYQREGQAVTNFEATLPPPQSDLAVQILKDPYVFDFLGLEEDAQEREIEGAMIRHLKDTLVEMGMGFAFVGQQVHLEVGERDFYVDLLFYHLKLHSYVVVELKAVEFQPEFSGKLNFYLSAVDDLVRDPDVDGPSIGLLLCRKKEGVVVEYALRDIHKPIGVADLQLTRLVPEDLKGELPTVEMLEAELAGGLPNDDQ